MAHRVNESVDVRSGKKVTPYRPAGKPEKATEERGGPSTVARMVERAIENPTLVIAGIAAIPLLFLAWGATRRWRDKRLAEDQTE